MVGTKVGVVVACVLLLVACGGEDSGSGDVSSDVPAPAAAPGGDPSGSAGSPTGVTPGVGDGGDGAQPGAAPPGSTPPPEQPPTAGAAGATAPPPPTTGPAPAPAGNADGPVDGDPSAPVVEIPGIACGGVPNALAIAPANHQIGGREVIVEYPCGKHVGARVTFILNLHGTMPEESLKFYQHANFSAYRLINSHNIVQVSPKSVVAQWGNGDAGADEPHLLEIVDWVYSTFSDYQIDSMWVVGHSWGSGYAAGFVCHPSFADRATGVVLMSGPAAVACGDRVSIIGSTGEVDTGNPNLEAVASSHGCGPRTDLPQVGETTIEDWPCPAGADGKPDFVYRNYTWLGRGHQVAPGDWAHEAGVDHLVMAIKSLE